MVRRSAAAANAAEADVYLGLRLVPERDGCSTAYYSGYRYESAGGKRLAELVNVLAAAALGVPAHGVQGMSLAVLRETRMPAVVCEVGTPAVVVRHAGPLAEALVRALVAWAATPVD